MDTKQLLEAAQTLSVIQTILREPSNEWLPVFAAIGGAFVGGIATVVPSSIMEWQRRRHERNSIANALLSEISALLTVIEARQYIQHLQQVHAHLQQRPDQKITFVVKIQDHYSRVYQAHVDNIGLLPTEMASKIIRFHQLIDSIVQDIAPGGLVAEEGGDVNAFAQLISIAESAESIGRELVGKISSR